MPFYVLHYVRGGMGSLKPSDFELPFYLSVCLCKSEDLLSHLQYSLALSIYFPAIYILHIYYIDINIHTITVFLTALSFLQIKETNLLSCVLQIIPGLLFIT